jgi:hypothetical protein
MSRTEQLFEGHKNLSMLGSVYGDDLASPSFMTRMACPMLRVPSRVFLAYGAVDSSVLGLAS